MLLPATLRQGPPPISHVPFLPGHARLDVIQPMLGDLDTATTGGRRYVMGKLLAQLDDAVSAAQHIFPDVQRRALRSTLAVMARESERMLPDADAFARGARTITAMLSAV